MLNILVYLLYSKVYCLQFPPQIKYGMEFPLDFLVDN